MMTYSKECFILGIVNIIKVPESFSIKSYKMRLTLYTLFGLIIADGLLTNFLVTNGYGIEANPFLRAWVGKDIFFAIKVSGAFLATLILWVKYNWKPKLIYSITVVFLALYTGIVFWNLFVFLAI